MIQRIQSIFLILIALVLLVALGFPVWKSTSDSSETVMTPVMTRTTVGESISETYNNAPLAAILVVVAGLAIFSLLKFNNRLLQMKLGMGISLLLSVFLGLTIYFTSDLSKETGNEGQFGIAFYMTAFSVVLNIVANRFIKRDEDLVRDADRIR